MVSERIHSLQLRSIAQIRLMEQAHNPLINTTGFLYLFCRGGNKNPPHCRDGPC